MAMSTYNFTDGSISGVPRTTESTMKETEIMVLRQIVDFSKQNLDAGEADVAECLNIPAGVTVMTAGLRVITADAANTTVDLGYGGDVDKWGDALSLAAGDVVVGYLQAPVYFASADTIDIKATTDGADVNITAAKVEITALCLKQLDSY